MSVVRVSAAEKVRSEIDALFADPDRELGEVLEEVARRSVRLVLQSALEAEVGEFLGRDRYARGQRAREGQRNGYAPITVKTTAGPVRLDRPKVRGTLERFSSRLLGKHVTRTNALESLVISGWGPGPVRPRHQRRPGRGAGPAGEPEPVHRLARLRGHQRRVRRLAGP